MDVRKELEESLAMGEKVIAEMTKKIDRRQKEIDLMKIGVRLERPLDFWLVELAEEKLRQEKEYLGMAEKLKGKLDEVKEDKNFLRDIGADDASKP